MFSKHLAPVLLAATLVACGEAPKSPMPQILKASAPNPAAGEGDAAAGEKGNENDNETTPPDTVDKPETPEAPTNPSEPIKPIEPIDPVIPKPNDPIVIANPPDMNDCSQVVDQCPVPGGVTWQCKKRFLHGVNYAWHNFSGDFGGVPGYNQGGVAASAQAVDQELLEMRNHGASVIRWWIMPDFRGAGVKFDANSTPTGLGATVEADLLKALELAEKHDLYLMMTLFSFDGFKPTHTTDGITIRSIKPMVIDAAKREALMEKIVRPLVKIAEKSPHKKRLMTWELINEPEWAMAGVSKYGDPNYECSGGTFECVSHQEMETFLADMAKVVRSESKALVSVGGAAIKWKNAWTKLDMDYYQYHIYDWVNTYFPYTKSPADWGLTDKPVVMGEFPFDGVTGANASKLLDSWYGNGFGGAMGWAVTDPVFNWSANRAAIKSFGDKHKCETRY